MITHNNYKGMHYLTFNDLKQFPDLKVLMTTRNVFTVPELKDRICELFGCGAGAMVTVKQVHGNVSEAVDEEYLAEYRRCSHSTPPEADAMMTPLRNVPLGVFTADCLPIVLYAAEPQALCLVHAGKAGTAKLVTLLAADKMLRLYDLKPDAVTALIGPSIGPCCYDLDLWRENERQLQSAGITRIINPRICTACNIDRYFSYRREKGTPGRMITAAMLV